jgi:signal transduction histidine kinase
LASLDQFSYRFTRLQVDRPECSINQSLTSIGNITSDILAPLAVGLFLDCGFTTLNEVISENTHFRQSLLCEFPKSRDAQSITNLEGSDTNRVDIFRNRLVITPRERAPKKLYFLGDLIIAVPEKQDDIARPTLGANMLYLRAVGAQVSDALFDTTREFMNNLLGQFSIDLNSNEVNSVAAWFDIVHKAARAAGIMWVVGAHSGDDMMGEDGTTTLVQELTEREPQWESPRSGDRAAAFTRYDLDKPIGEARHVVRLHLNPTTQLWLGIERPNFGFEIEFNTPWAAFLYQFIDIANSALIRFTAAKDMERFQKEAFHYQGLATVAATTGTFIHQIGNCTTSISFTANSLLEAYRAKAFECTEHYGEMIAAMCESTGQLFNLTSSILNVTKVDDRRPCQLFEAAIQSKHLFDLALSQRNIKLEIDVGLDLFIDVPFYVAALAVACLVDNAKDILSDFRTDGVIKIEASAAGDMVHCYVSDNGPGIRKDLREKIFDIGVTTKPKSGGWGLYLIKRSLQENRSSIKMVDMDQPGATFQIRFPKPKQES